MIPSILLYGTHICIALHDDQHCYPNHIDKIALYFGVCILICSVYDSNHRYNFNPSFFQPPGHFIESNISTKKGRTPCKERVQEGAIAADQRNLARESTHRNSFTYLDVSIRLRSWQ